MHQSVVTLGTNKICLFLNIFRLITRELQDKNDIKLVLLMQKLSGYQIKVFSVFYVSVSDVKYLRECPEPQ